MLNACLTDYISCDLVMVLKCALSVLGRLVLLSYGHLGAVQLTNMAILSLTVFIHPVDTEWH